MNAKEIYFIEKNSKNIVLDNFKKTDIFDESRYVTPESFTKREKKEIEKIYSKLIKKTIIKELNNNDDKKKTHLNLSVKAKLNKEEDGTYCISVKFAKEINLPKEKDVKISKLIFNFNDYFENEKSISKFLKKDYSQDLDKVIKEIQKYEKKVKKHCKTLNNNIDKAPSIAEIENEDYDKNNSDIEDNSLGFYNHNEEEKYEEEEEEEEEEDEEEEELPFV